MPRVGCGQTPADRVVLDSLYPDLARDSAATGAFSGISCGARDVAPLCDAAILLHRGELSANKGEVSRAHDLIDQLAVQHATWPEVWYLLAAAELVGDDAGVGPREGPLQVAAEGNPAQAEQALIHALALDSTFVRAAEALALVPISHNGTGFLRARVDALRRMRALLPPAYLVAEAVVEREAGHTDSAIALSVRALRDHAAPRGVIDVTVAGDLFAVGEDSIAQITYFGGANDTGTLSRRGYRDQLAWLATGSELAAWDSTPVPGRVDWLRRFWAERDLRDGRPGGSRLKEQYQRLAEAEQMYRFRYATVHRRDSLWLIPDDRANKQRFAFLTDYAADVSGTEQPFVAFSSREDLLDDRGVMYMRQGMPHLAMRSTGQGGIELWQYVRGGQPFYLSFGAALPIGSPVVVMPYAARLLKTLADTAMFNAPAALIATVADTADSVYGYLHQDFCALKASLCRSVPDSQTYSFPRMNCSEAAPLARISWRLGDRRFTDTSRNALEFMYQPPSLDWAYIRERDREEGEWTIAQAQNTDDFGVPFDRSISPTFVVHVLNRGADDRLVVGVEVGAKDLPVPEIDWDNAQLKFPIRLHVAALRTEDLLRFDIDTLITVSANALARRDHHLAALVDLPLPPGHYQTSAWVNQLMDNSGVLVHDDSVVIGRRNGILWLSDLLVGGADDPLTWNSGSGVVRIAPRGDVERHGSTDLYYQLRGLVPGSSYRTALQLYRTHDDQPEKSPSLTLTFSEHATAAATDITRHLDVGTLDTGAYRIRIVVDDGAQHAESTGCLTIVK